MVPVTAFGLVIVGITGAILSNLGFSTGITTAGARSKELTELMERLVALAKRDSRGSSPVESHEREEVTPVG